MELLSANVFGNPHSSNPTSMASTEHVEATRAAILAFFNAAPDEYEVIFSQNASGALKLVGESYPFEKGDHYLLTFDNHNSVNGIREFAAAAGATVTYTPVLPPDMRIDAATLTAHLEEARPNGNNLFAYPAQSNFSGVQHALDWIPLAQEKGWDVLLDAAAFVPSNTLDLSQWHPDFVPISFYKMFGYPTGLGCLLARRQALAKLRRPWFAGGTITVASVQGDKYYFAEGPEAFEDGTLNYLALPAVEIGLRHIQQIGLDAIHTRVMCLTEWLLRELTALAHPSGVPLMRIYGPVDSAMRGGTVTLNFYDRDGHFIDHRLVEKRANAVGISLRTGCFCNPGDGELALGISADELTSCFVRHDRLTLDEFRRCIDDKSTGAVRISVGLATTFADVYACVTFARTFLDKTVAQLLDEVR
jgi:selenocysteine lyase/cysteine desulfurase